MPSLPSFAPPVPYGLSMAGLRNVGCGDRPGTIVLVFQRIALRTLHVNVGSNCNHGANKDKCRSAGFVVASGPPFESTVKIVTFGAMHNLYLSVSGSRVTN